MHKTKKLNVISQINKDKFFKTQLHLHVIIEEGFKIINENENVFHIYNSLFKRYLYNFESVGVLLKDFDVNKKHRVLPISIVLRASLLDYLTTLYLITFQAEKKFKDELDKEYKIVVDKLMSEQIRRIISVNENDKKTKFYNHNEHCQTVDLLKVQFPHLFNQNIEIDYNKPSKSLIYNINDDIKPGTIRKRLDNISNQLENIHYEDAFYLYDLYSKYDHFGTISIFLENTNIDLVCSNILGALFHICEGLGFCIDLMIEEVNCKSDFRKIEHEISFLRGVIHSKTFWLSDEYKKNNQ